MTIPTPSPADFDAYWSETMEELAALPVAAELTISPMRSTDFATLYDVHLTSIGPYRIFAYVSIPHGEGPFPVIYHTPGYGSVVHIPPHEERQRFVSVSLRHRGQRLADQPFAAAYPGLLTTGIDSPATYIYRGIVADCCRVVDFLLERPEVDASRISVVGNELALFTAALRPQVGLLHCTPGLFISAEQHAPATNAYPLEELNDYVRAYPERADAVWRTLSYFEPAHFAPRVKAATRLVSGVTGDLCGPDVVSSLAAAFDAPVDIVETGHSGYVDGVALATWLCDLCGYPEVVVPAQWQ